MSDWEYKKHLEYRAVLVWLLRHVNTLIAMNIPVHVCTCNVHPHYLQLMSTWLKARQPELSGIHSLNGTGCVYTWTSQAYSWCADYHVNRNSPSTAELIKHTHTHTHLEYCQLQCGLPSEYVVHRVSICFSSSLEYFSELFQLSLLLLSSSRPSCLSVTGAPSLMRASRITMETQNPVVLVRMILLV